MKQMKNPKLFAWQGRWWSLGGNVLYPEIVMVDWVNQRISFKSLSVLCRKVMSVQWRKIFIHKRQMIQCWWRRSEFSFSVFPLTVHRHVNPWWSGFSNSIPINHHTWTISYSGTSWNECCTSLKNIHFTVHLNMTRCLYVWMH